MTDTDYKALVERLRQRQAEHVEHHLAIPHDHDALEAADAIETLVAEKAFWRERAINYAEIADICTYDDTQEICNGCRCERQDKDNDTD